MIFGTLTMVIYFTDTALKPLKVITRTSATVVMGCTQDAEAENQNSNEEEPQGICELSNRFNI